MKNGDSASDLGCVPGDLEIGKEPIFRGEWGEELGYYQAEWLNAEGFLDNGEIKLGELSCCFWTLRSFALDY